MALIPLAELLDLLARLHIPETNSLVSTTRDQPFAILAERETANVIGVDTKHANLSAGRGIPDTDDCVLASGRQELPIWTVGDTQDMGRVPQLGTAEHALDILRQIAGQRRQHPSGTVNGLAGLGELLGGEGRLGLL